MTRKRLLIVCLVVFSLGLVMLLFARNMRISDTKEEWARQDIKNIKEAIKIFKNREGRLPATIYELTQKELDKNGLRDPWGRQYSYHSTGDQFELYSQGANGIDENGRGDDITYFGNK